MNHQRGRRCLMGKVVAVARYCSTSTNNYRVVETHGFFATLLYSCVSLPFFLVQQ